MSMFYKSPKCCKTDITVGDALQQMQHFNAAFEISERGSFNNAPEDVDRVNWRTQIKEGVIQCDNAAIEFNFFEQMVSGPTTALGATDLYTKEDCGRDYNIYAQDAATGAGPGGAVVFTMARANHDKSGKLSNIAEGGNVYIYQDHQWLRVTAIDKTVDYAHVVTAYPFNKAYTANVRKGTKMMWNPVRFIDGYSCSIPTSTWPSPGYIKKWQPFRVRKDWEMPYKLDGPMHDIAQFHLIFNADGSEADSFEMYNKTEARRELQAMKNLAFFIGQKIDNPALVGMFNDDNYLGFEGLLPMIRYGGGAIYDFDPAYGFDIKNDFQSLVMQNDATKRSKEFVGFHGMNFGWGLDDRADETFRGMPTGACTFESFVRSGADKADIERLGVRSMRYGNFSIHFKMVEALSDTRYLGNYDFPNLGILMPGTGLTNSKGESVPAVEFFNVGAGRQTASLTETFRDHMQLESGCEKVSGSLIESYMMAVHCTSSWTLLNPIMPQA